MSVYLKNAEPYSLKPREGICSLIKPYIELIRLDKPAGIFVCFIPCLLGTTLLACTEHIAPKDFAYVNAVLLWGSILVRSLGCAWNDTLDKDVDQKVQRTCQRPLARGALSRTQAIVLSSFILALGIASIFTLLPVECFYYGIPSMLLVAIYPLGKRFTNYPQLILAIPGSWGIVLAFPAFGISPITVSSTTQIAASSLIGVCICWTVLYDSIYAAQDLDDDLEIGVKSIMTRHHHHVRWLMRSIASVQCCLLFATAIYMDQGPGVIGSFSALSSIAIFTMVEKVNFTDRDNCAWWFKKGNSLVGLVMACGLLSEYARQLLTSCSSCSI